MLVSAEFLSSHHSLFGASFAASRRAQLSRTAAQPSPLQPPADLVLSDGKIYTGLAAQPWASAVAIRGEFIVAIPGTAILTCEQVKSWVGPKTRVIDLHGQFAMPGFNDAHAASCGRRVRQAGSGPERYEIRRGVSAEDSREAERVWAGRMDYRSRMGPHAVAGEEISQPAGSGRDLDRASDIFAARGWPRRGGEFASAQNRRDHSRDARSARRAHRTRSGHWRADWNAGRRCGDESCLRSRAALYRSTAPAGVRSCDG